ncbi:hypothetical protein GUITHDRAFT_103393 [Guillardia theta CCMP2712]|uniref:Uncharacterized protein n=1 Tax=Guillardia theta (strain CCMP2712) TaxID=905079 RepID=L1JRB3_GUITC|nr:hypothetical protein GUITHDRAFT_103393 [Guillardia theta CCMP2712]EKX50804.1 hypothetical protein GUITHDRAFT_103393 [Guillardia theta CCMP2712]|eukprot:XP_005837784.1 hypothetical protein GUITHDRAFT_103393 [Guillardia theta CCMP2712]
MDKKTDEVVLSFPACKVISNPLAVNKLVGHLEVCKDCCESFGSTVTLRVISRGEQESPYFQIKSIQGTANSDGFDEDDDDDWDILSKYADLLDGEETTPAEIELEKLTQVPEDDAEVLKIIRDWVNVIISDMGVCPFSRSADKAGLPLGPVHYSISRQSRPEEIYSEYWKEVSLLIQRDESDISTTLHILPNFYIGNCEAFTSFTDTLSQSLSALGIEKYIQLVFFHPQWVFRDGADRMGESGAANFARRSSFPMINILRTNQVRLAQKSIPTGLVYTQNEETLMEVGAENLQKMLVERDWSSLMVRKALEEQIRELEAKGKTPPSNRVEYEAKDRSSDDGMAF